MDTENKILFYISSPFGFEQVDCLGTDITQFGLQMPEEYLLTPREENSCEMTVSIVSNALFDMEWDVKQISFVVCDSYAFFFKEMGS